MSEAALATKLNCPNCGGEQHPDEAQQFIVCPYCSSTIYVDKSQVVFHWYVAPTLDEGEARSALARWMAGNDTVKDLDKKSKITVSSFKYFPLWYFKRKFPNGRERIRIQPAAATAISELKKMRLPAGDMIKYDPKIDPDAIPPNVPLEAALNWVDQDRQEEGEIAEMAITHVPLYAFKYKYEDRSYTAMVDAATGKVMANIFPEKDEMPYRLVGGGAAFIFLGLSVIPVIGSVFGEEGFFGGLVICFGLGIPAAVVIAGLAAWVSQKV